MDTFSEDPWATLAGLCKQHRAARLDILTGFLGSGATEALRALGVSARIIIGLPRGDAAMSEAQIEELKRLKKAHQVRWLRGLHAKLYVLPGHAAMIGSANFSRPGFSTLDELVLATTTRALIAAAQQAFDRRWHKALDLVPATLVPIVAAGDVDRATSALGSVPSPRGHAFAVPPKAGATRPSTSAIGPQAGPLGVLFVNVGWHATYDASSLPTGNHRYLNSRDAQTNGSSDEALFVNDHGRHLGPAGRGALPDFERLDVVFTATEEAGAERRVVAIFRDCVPEPHYSGLDFMMVRAAHNRVTCFPVSRRPKLDSWPGRMSMRRWATGGPNNNHPDLRTFYEELMHTHGE